MAFGKKKKEIDPETQRCLDDLEEQRKQVLSGKIYSNEERAQSFERQYDLLRIALERSILTETWKGTMNMSALLDRVRDEKSAWAGDVERKNYNITFELPPLEASDE